MYESGHQRYMQRALELAQRGQGRVDPNPMVGAVLVHNDVILGEGWHHQYGDVHAEVDCLQNVHAEFRHLVPESTLYVSLEPCAHTGRQPPCAARIVQEGIRKVVVCNDDPFEAVRGKGFAILEHAGVEVIKGILKENGEWQNRRFLTFHKNRRPYIVLKWAVSADGYIAPESRARIALSNHYSHTLSHKWRTEEDAIIVGHNTALHDNPELTARAWRGGQPLRIALDRQLNLPKTCKLFNSAAPTWIINEKDDAQQDNLLFVKLNFNHSVPEQILEKLYAEQKLSLIVEGGAQLLRSFISAGLWDEARIFRTRKNLGNGVPAPHLLDTLPAHNFALVDDTLSLFLNSGSAPFIAGMEL